MAYPTAGGGVEDALVASALESMVVAVVIIDLDGRVVRHNERAAHLLGTSVLASPVRTWSLWCTLPTASGTTVPVAEFPALRALRGEVCDGVELVWQAGTAVGARLIVTASPLREARDGAVLTFMDVSSVGRRASPEDSSPLTRLTAELTPPRVGVLVVEDDAESRGATVGILRGAGFAVVEAGCASDALRVAVATSLPMHVLLTDLILDDETGPELAHQLLQIRPRLSILYMSDHPWGALLPPKTSRSGPGLLRKPLSADALVAAVTRASTGDVDEPPVDSARSLGRVLLVDDDSAMRMGASDVLRNEGFDVVEASDGRTAMEAAQAAELDVVVSDIHMAGMTGIELLRQIRARDIDVPVILMTGAPRVESATSAVEYGAYRYLTKPIDIQNLIDVVHLAIRSGRFARLRRDAQAMAGHDAWRPSDAAGLDVRLERALADLWLEYQPLIPADGGKITAFEALVRTGEPSLRNPALLFNAADQQGRTAEVGRAIRRLAAQALGAGPSTVELHVNIDMLDLQDPDLHAPDAPLSLVAHRVVLELNERQAVIPGSRFEDQIRDLRAMGFRFALDDLGAGRAGLTTFSLLAPDMVKLDPSLVRGIHATPAKRKTIAAMIALCRDMNVEVVAEGVELEEERTCLTELGCDLLQGYLFARPTRELGASAG